MRTQQNDKFLKQIQSSLRKKKDGNGTTFKNVTYSKIREVIASEFKEVDPENITDDEKKRIVNFIHQERLEQRQQRASAPTVATSTTVPSVANTTDTNSTAMIEQEQEVQEASNPTTAPNTQESAPLAVTEKQSLSKNQPTNIATKTLAPQEAVAIIEEIAQDNTSRYKQVASELLTQLDSKTDSIVALVAAAPEIEAEMLRRKLHQINHKTVDYDAIIGSHFRQSTTEITDHISNLAAEYGVTI